MTTASDASLYSGSVDNAREEPVRTLHEFEGDVVTGVTGKFPALSIDLVEGYTKGTHLRLEVEVRVKNVQYNEDRHGNTIRQHVFSIESAQVKSAFRPEDVRDDVGGSASAHPMPQPVAGVALGRSSDTWGATAPSKPAEAISESSGDETSEAETGAEVSDEDRESAAIAWLIRDLDQNEAVGF